MRRCLSRGASASDDGILEWFVPWNLTMRIRTPFVWAAIIAAATAQTASAQSTSSTSRAKKAPTAMAKARPKSSFLRKRSTRHLPPPPPPPVAARSSSAASSPYGALINDPTGRVDKSGRPVPFYPSARTLQAARTQATANRQRGNAVPRENPQKDAIKRP